MHRIIRKIIPFILVLAIFFGTFEFTAYAEPAVLMPPQRNRITDVGYIREVYADKWYAQLNWDAVTFPPEAEETYIYLGLNEIASGTGKIINDALQVALPGSATGYEINDYTPEGIKHGTIYEAYVRASYNTTTATGKYTVSSQKSNIVKFLTNLHVSVELIPGTNYIKIKWDDVWDTNGRINYRILISDTKGFSQPTAIPDIIASEIGKPGSPVTVNSQEKKLEYVYTSALPGREYSIKVVPLPNSNVACATADEIGSVTIKTDILLKAQRVGYTNDGDTIWKLFWNLIVKGNVFTRVDYELYRYVDDEDEGTLFRLVPDVDSYEFIVKKGDTHTYSFKVDAKAYVQGSPAPIEFRSNNKVALKEQIPQQPEAPELVDEFPNADPEPLYYEDMLKPDGATILWRVPYTGEGLVDTDVTYDIYLLENIKDVANPPSNYKIASDLTMGESNKIRDKITGKVTGYRYTLTGLRSNSTYYFVIYAKKNYLVENNDSGLMVTMPYISKQSVKVIITKPDTGTDRPIAPSSPPFGVKPGDDSITYTQATLVMEKRWHALYDSSTKRWERVTADEYIDNEALPSDSPDKRKGMIVNYLPGWTIVPHVVRYSDAINVIRMRGNRNGEYITYSDLSQPDIKAFEIPQTPVAVPDIPENAADQTFTFDVKGLTHNTAYIVWITVQNQNGNTSDPSDPLIITTIPQIPDIPVTPTVPTDLRGVAGDTYVDLFWTYIDGMDYEIRGGTQENMQSSTITMQVSSEDTASGTFARIEGLTPDTVYYFWIKAISKTSDGKTIESQYSNPLVIRTEPYAPPAPPTGFGVRAGADGVTENSITYEWNALPNITYILEFADNTSFNNAKTFNVSGNTYTVTNLIANRRYYARLYAYDPKTTLRSEPTRTIMVVTDKSRDEYDGSFDLTEPVGGNGLVIPVKLENGVWRITSLGNDAHVLAERIRSVTSPVVKLDFSVPPASTSTIRIDIGTIVFDALAEQHKDLYVKLPWGQFTITSGTFQNDNYFKLKGKNNNLSIRIESVSPASSYKPSSYMKIKTQVTDLKLSYLNVQNTINDLVYPIRVELPIENAGQYLQGQVRVYSYNSSGWYELPGSIDYVRNWVVGELGKPGPIVAAAWEITPTNPYYVPTYISESLESIQSVYKLKSLEGKAFQYNANITPNAILKCILDVIGADYTEYDIASKALQANLISSLSEASGTYARRDKAIHMLVSLYRFKTREKAVPVKPTVWAQYKDMSRVESAYLNDFRFAIENAVIQGNGLNLAYPEQPVTYGDFIVMLERILRLCGEI